MCIRDRLKSANRKTVAPVMFKPQPGLPPVKPNTDMTAANLGALGTIAGGVSTGLDQYATLNDGRMPWEKA